MRWTLDHAAMQKIPRPRSRGLRCILLALAVAACGDPETGGAVDAGGAGAPTAGAGGGVAGAAADAAAGGDANGAAGNAGGTSGGGPAAGGTGAAGAAGAPRAGDDAGASAASDAGGLAGRGANDAATDASTLTPPAGEGVVIDGGTLLVDGAPFQIQGVCWNPVGRGGVHPADLDFAGFAATDAPLMREAGINVVRTYETITDTGVLDTLYAAGIRVLNMAYVWGGDDPSVVDARVDAVKDHPAILMWVLGNEWNYNGLYVGLSHQESMDALNAAAARIRDLDDAHPIATVYGEIPSADVVDAMPLVDVWGINAYRGLGFGSLFDQFEAVSDKPMFVAEYGADAYDANQGAVNLSAQAEATRALTQEILDHGASRGLGSCLGGTIFEWADEWWKDSGGSADVHDVGGIAPGGGPYPDQTFNEEWWGVVDVDRSPRPAYDALKALYASP